jgi:CECR6/TMEM121 family
LGAVIFLLLAESHNWARHRSARFQFVTSTCAHSGMAVLDTVSLLSVLLPQDAARQTEPPELLMDLILVLCLFNLLLPALALYRLGLSEPSAAKAQERLILPFNVINDVTHFLLVDLPFLLIRSYLWIGHRQHTTLFMMKNVLGIMMTLRSLQPDLHALCKRRRQKEEGAEEVGRQQGETLLELKTTENGEKVH